MRHRTVQYHFARHAQLVQYDGSACRRLAAHDFTGKTILPFCTHGGGGMGHILKDVHKLASGAAVRDGLEVYEGGLTAAGEKTAAWLKKNDLGRK